MHPHSRGTRCPSFSSEPPSIMKRAQGMPDARCTRGRVCNKKNTRVSNHRYTASTGIPCTMVLTVSFVISPVTMLFCHRRLAGTGSARLSAYIGAPGPHDFAVRISAARLASLPRPSHPVPNVRDDREPPLFSGTRRTKKATDLGVRSTAADWHDGQISS